MPHPIHRVVSFRIVGPYTLEVYFDDGVRQTICFEPILAGELLGPLKDVRVFQRVRLDEEAHTLVWPNGADFDPETLHDWTEHEPDLIARARRWEARAA